MAEKYFDGKNGSVTANGVAIPVQNWKATHSIGENDVTATTSNGKYEVQGGIEKLEGSFEAKWEQTSGNGPFSGGGTSSVNGKFAAGHNITNLVLTVGPGEAITMPQAFVKNCDSELDVTGVVKYTVNFTSNGDFTLPNT